MPVIGPWYPTDADGKEFTRAGHRLDALKAATGELGLELIDMGMKEGGTYQIPAAMYQALASSDMMLADLTGVRPNGMIEVGFALRNHATGRMPLYYETSDGTKAPFDIAAFRHVQIDQAADIKTKRKPLLVAIINQAQVGLI